MTREGTQHSRLAVAATTVVQLHLPIAHAHGLSHDGSEMPMEPRQVAFLRAVVHAAPLLAAALSWTPLRRPTAAPLGPAILSGTAFGGDLHFVAIISDRVCDRPTNGSGTLFVDTAALLVPDGAPGAASGAWSWRRPGRTA